MKRTALPAVSLLACVMLLAGCNVLPAPQADNTRYFLLESVAGPAAESGAVRLGLRRVEVPAYLRSKAIVSRSGDNELRYAGTARWAEPLEAGLTRLLRDQLGARAAVSSYPFPAQVERDFDVVVTVVAAEGRDDGVHFTANFELARAADSVVVVRRTFVAPVKAWSGDYAQLAAQLSAATAGLAGEILSAMPAK